MVEKIENYRLKDALNQRSYLMEILHRFMPEYDDYNDPRVWRYTGTISYKQYRRIIAIANQEGKEKVIAEVKPLIEAIPTSDDWDGEH